MSNNFTEKNNETLIENIFIFANSSPYLFTIILISIIVVMVLLAKWDLKIWWKHQETEGDAIMNSTINGNEKK